MCVFKVPVELKTNSSPTPRQGSTPSKLNMYLLPIMSNNGLPMIMISSMCIMKDNKAIAMWTKHSAMNLYCGRTAWSTVGQFYN